MSSVLAVPLFLASLAVTLLAARSFAQRLDKVGARFGFPEAVVGLLTAVAADGPEISSALVALVKGAHSTSVGVLVGSNTFNLAAMLGVSALLAGSVRLSLEALAPEGLVCAAITVIAAAVLLRWLGPVPGAILTALVIGPYLVWLREAERHSAGQTTQAASTSDPTHHLLGLIVVDVSLIIGGSFGMVEAALTLGHSWHVSDAILGVLILAPLTSLPNAATAIRLGMAGRTTALAGETYNSNTINLAVGVIIPALFVTFDAQSTTAKIQIAWLVAMTVASLSMLARRRGIGRPQAVVLVIAYLGFVAVAALGS
jgi:cation:H+ antiporter